MKMTHRLKKAIDLAATAHDGQKRKASAFPYIVHPFSVMCIASQVTDDEDVLIACLMHDVLEDVPDRYPAESMRNDFGDRVLSLVRDVTKDESQPDHRAEQEAYLRHLENEAPDEAVIVACADKIDNLMSILRNYSEIGEEVWARFKSDKDGIKWWYESVLRICQKRIPNLVITTDLEKYVKELRGI